MNDMNDESNNSESSSRADLVRVLKEFPLTYEQHQILHKPGIEILVHRILRKRHWFTVSLAVLASACFALAIRGLVFGFVYSLLLVTGVVLGYWAYRRVNRSRALLTAYQRYEESRLERADESISLGDALRLSFSLDYDEHQAIHQGDDQLVADRMIDRFNKNSAGLALGGAGISLITWNRVGLHALPFIVVMVAAVGVCCLWNWLQTQRVKAIVEQHSDTTIASQQDPLQSLREASIADDEEEQAAVSNSRQTTC
ncbi:hypothetical protein [Rhodopirellula bahusiensis]|uniref:hypothetical protein n=2 Tax=Rhodopirellula bahusiensis TaxID=2014065 RepID=UPI003296E3DA